MSNPTTKEKKTRVFDLAKELGVASKELVALAQELGYAAITNQLNGLEHTQVDALKDRFKKGALPKVVGGMTRAPAATKPVTLPPPGKIEQKVQTLAPAKPKPAPPRPAPVVADPVPVAPVAEVAPPTPVPAPADPTP